MIISLPLIASEKDKSQPATSQTTQSDRSGMVALQVQQSWVQWATFQKPRVIYVREDQASGNEPLIATTAVIFDNISSTSKPSKSYAQIAADKALDCYGMGSDSGAKIGVVSTGIIVNGVGEGYNRVKTDLIDLVYKGKEIVVLTAATTAAPIVGGAVVLAGTGYAGYKIFRYFKPTPKMVAKEKEEMAEIEHKTNAHHAESAKHKSDTEKYKSDAEKYKSDAEKHKTETVKHESELGKHIEEQFKLAQCKKFNNCLEKNRRSISFTTYGLPLECEDEAFNVSLHDDGDDRIQLLAKKFAKYAPRPG